MKAHLHSYRLAPKKTNLIAGMVRGLSVRHAMDILERTPKKGAQAILGVIRSALANAVHNDRQHADDLFIRRLLVNQGTAYRRGVPMARGRVRPIRKFTSHIEVVLGVGPTEKKNQPSSALGGLRPASQINPKSPTYAEASAGRQIPKTKEKVSKKAASKQISS
ncbi:50S ribosomal protein L22 [Candidatus Peregrinibacteria bacterium]|nr:50S ribosomal protein L22 [Candidatus Peregrinibacteria bacterium]